ncbi:hypothetical protein C8Q80DRAFT_1185394 [Daedaleopsis nitida]|nr:hypothetical protein C8Q80DRAFT_1185394 [Daedaleopsis nitida]
MLGHPPPAYQQQPPQQQQPQQQSQPPTADPNALHHNPPQPQPGGTFQTLRLRDDPPSVTQQAPRASRKRKSPATASADTGPAPPPGPPNPGAMPPPPPVQMQPHALPPPHTLIHPPPPHLAGHPMAPQPQSDQARAAMAAAGGRTLSQSKRAEQNRKAQRAFRERRDQHVKTLESRSQLLDAALASADEANRRWEECRTIVDQLRIENATLRAALQATQSQLNSLNPNTNVLLSDPNAVNGANGAPPLQAPPPGQQERAANGNEEKNDQAPGSADDGQEKK